MTDYCGKCRKIMPDDQLGYWITLVNYQDIDEESPYRFEYNVCQDCWKLTKEFLEQR